MLPPPPVVVDGDVLIHNVDYAVEQR